MNENKIINDTAALLEVRNISKSYKLKGRTITVLDSISFEVNRGQILAITGPSGSGKSTLLHIIGGLDKPTSGDVLVENEAISNFSKKHLAQFRQKTIGFVFQFFYLQPFLSLRNNIEIPAMFLKTDQRLRTNKTEQLSKLVGLDDRLEYFPKQLSGGQIQRAAIARALINEPKLLLADEPTGNLDPQNTLKVMDMFKKVQEQLGTTIVIATHDELVANVADRVLTLRDRRVYDSN